VGRLPHPPSGCATLGPAQGEKGIPVSSSRAPRETGERAPITGVERFPVYGQPAPPAPPAPPAAPKPDPWWLSGRAGLAALLAGGLLGAAPLVGRLAGADPQALVGLALVAFVGAWLWLAGAAILLRWTLRRGGWWYAASALLLAGLVRGVLSLLAPAGG
jgi:hypothetical protein